MEALKNFIIVCSVMAVTSMGQLISPPVKVVDVPTCLTFNNYFRFGHETDCIYFYECHAGLTYLLQCPDRSWFDSNTQNCTEDESVCHSNSEDKEDDSKSMDADDISDSFVPNKRVSIVYKYIYVTERSKRINRAYHRNRDIINPVTATDVDTDIETDSTRQYNDNEIRIEGYEYETSTLSSTTSDYSLEEDTEPAPRRKFIYQTPRQKIPYRKRQRYGHEKNKKRNMHTNPTRRVYRNVEDLLQNGEYDDNPTQTKRNYRKQLKRFVTRLKSQVRKTTKKFNDNDEIKKKTKSTTEPADYETDWPNEVTRAPIKKITSTKKGKKRTNSPTIRYVNFGSYAAPFNPYKIKGRFFLPSFINKEGSNSKLVKRSLFRKSRSTTSTARLDKNITKQTHKLEKRNGFHLTLNLKEKTKLLNSLQYSTNRPLFDTYLTTPPPDSFDILKLFKPSIEDNSLTALENPRVKVNEIDLLKLYELNKSSRKSYNKEKFIDKSDENLELHKSSNDDKTEPSNFLPNDDDSSRQYIVIHYRRRRLPAHLRPATDFYSTDSDVTPLTTNPTILTSTSSSTSIVDKYINSFHYGNNFDFEKEFSKVRKLISRDYPNYSAKYMND